MISLYFGSPGCGKTTQLAKIAYLESCGIVSRCASISRSHAAALPWWLRLYLFLKRKLFFKKSNSYDYIFSTERLNIPGVRFIPDISGLGRDWTLPPRSLLLVDEGGIEFNNRKHKDFSQDTIRWFKKHRHFHCDVIIFSQSWEDCDVTIRRLTDQLYYMRRFGPLTVSRRIRKCVRVDKETQQIIDGYSILGFLFSILPFMSHPKFTWRPHFYGLFNSFSDEGGKPLPVFMGEAEFVSPSSLNSVEALEAP